MEELIDMTMNYQDTLEDVKATVGIVPGFMKALPEDVLMHDWPLFKKYSLGESAIPQKYRELMGLAVAANIKCPYCQAMHTDMAKGYGATEEELREVYYLASFTARWSAMIHAQHYPMEQFDRERAQMGEHMMSMMKSSEMTKQPMRGSAASK